MSITVERLVKLAYIARIKDKRDGRRVNLTLTKQGERIKRAKSVLDPQQVRAMLARLTEAERKLALDGLGLLAYAAEMEMKSRSLGKSWNTKNPK
jgi:DNA-binding MarR family transcriptional regulator